jgi:hypothetical protein
MALKHLVESKRQARDKGRMAAVTRGATAGKAKEGAVQLGEMTRVVYEAHGANKLLKEKFMTDADQTTVLICQKCNNRCYVGARSLKVMCDTCGMEPDPLKVTIPYATVRLQNIQIAAGQSSKILVTPAEGFDHKLDDYETVLDPSDKPNNRPRESIGRKKVKSYVIE